MKITRRGLATTSLTVAALGLAALVGWSTAGERGSVPGLSSFVLYGIVLCAGLVSSTTLRRWSGRHVVLDALIFVPLCYCALLLIPALSWWAAALIAVAAGVALVPLAVRRRRRAGPAS